MTSFCSSPLLRTWLQSYYVGCIFDCKLKKNWYNPIFCVCAWVPILRHPSVIPTNIVFWTNGRKRRKNFVIVKKGQLRLQTRLKIKSFQTLKRKHQLITL